MDKLIAILIGILVAFSAILAIQLVPLASAHGSMTPMMTDMQSGMMGCMSGQMSAEQMDRNGDGLCDMCGMPISECLEMAEHMEEMKAEMPMMSMMGPMGSMGCHMGG